jgi:hypothetical protein
VAEAPRIPKAAVQGLAQARSITIQVEALEAEIATLRAQRARILFHANRAGATYVAIADVTGLRETIVAGEIAKYRDDNGLAALPRGRRRGISPKSKVAQVA